MELGDNSCDEILYLDYRNTPETRVLKFVLAFCDLKCVEVVLVKGDPDEVPSSLSRQNLPFEHSVVERESALEGSDVICQLPALVQCQEKFWIAGISTVVRSIMKILHRRDPESKWDKFLGFRGTCLKACSEVSSLTKLCEVDFPAAVVAVETEQLDLNCVSEMPAALAQLERHLRDPPALHNIRKHVRKRVRDGKEIPVGDNHMLKTFFSGFDLTVCDLVLLPSVASILAVLEQKNPQVIQMLPHTLRWYREVSALESVSEAMEKCNLHRPDLSFLQLDPGTSVPASNLADELEFKLRLSEEKKIYATKKVQQMNAKILPPLVERLNQHGACPEYSEHPCKDMSLQWELLPPAVDPAKGELKPERAKRKRQQIDNMLSVVRSMVSGSNVVVDFCSGGGHLGIAIAYFLTSCTVIMVENKEESIERARSRAQTLGLRNVVFCQCNLDYFSGKFDVGVSLHACGLVTDMVMQQCFDNRASFVICPCCYGAVCNTHVTSYPRSEVFTTKYGVSYKEYRLLGHAADQTSWDFDCALSRQGKHCMGLVDLDRSCVAKEHGYRVTLCTMRPYDCTPKNNVLIGYAS